MIRVTNNILIDEKSLNFKASRSSGPGGQNINKVNTRITLFFDVTSCQTLSETQRRKIQTRLASRADKNGVIRVSSQKHRTQRENREAALERLLQLLAGALKNRPIRKKTAIPHSARERRLDLKKKRGLLKQQRSKKNLIRNFED